MTEKEFFVEILKETPINSFVTTSEFLDYNNAKELGLIKFKEFKPISVRLAFNLTSNNFDTWIDYFKSDELTIALTHYWIYHNGTLIANGFDHLEINFFDKNYYNEKFNEYTKDFEIQFGENLSKELPDPKRFIYLIATHEHQGVYSLDIVTKIAEKELKLRFAIDNFDYTNLTKLLNEIKSNYRLEFQGAYANQSDKAECGLTMICDSLNIELMIESTKHLVSNLLWFQSLEKVQDVEKMIINSP